MRNNEGSARLQPTPNRSKSVHSRLTLDEVQGQNAGGSIERPLRRAVDQPGMKMCTVRRVAQGSSRKVEHCSGRIDADERPTGMFIGEDLEFKAAARAEDEYVRVVRGTFREKKPRHALHVGIAGHQARWVVRVTGNGLRI